jgi:hypothetical protein
MNAVPVGVFFADDTECKRISGNPAAQELVAVPPDTNISKSAPEEERPASWQEMKDGVPIPPADLPMQRATQGEVVRDYEMDLVFTNGEVRSVLGSALPLLDEHGKPRGGVAVLMDISELKRLEREREELLRREHHIAEMLQKAGVVMGDLGTFDGFPLNYEPSQWLLPDNQGGWLMLDLGKERMVQSVRLKGTNAGGFFTRGVTEYGVELIRENGALRL